MACGPGKIGDWLVLDKVGGLDLASACRLHDEFYDDHEGNVGEYKTNRKAVDKIFLDHMRSIVARRPYFIQRMLGTVVVYVYYGAVRLFGRWSFKRGE